MENIDEIIADAMAEEEVAKEQEKARAKKKATDNFKKELRESLINMVAELAPQAEQQIKIDLSEYISLVYMARDLDVFKRAIKRALKLNYSGKELYIGDGDEIADAFKTLYFEEYNNILAEFQEKGE